MNEHRVRTFSEFHAVVEKFQGRQKTIFRGLKDVDYELKPSVGRATPAAAQTKHAGMEKRLLVLFKESSLPHLTSRPQNDWEWLAIGQHHGLPSRLMDWSYNPLAAAFFAVEKEFSGDSVVYVFWGASTIQDYTRDPLGIEKVVRYRPPHVSVRISAQAGLFTAHPNPTQPFAHRSMERIIIENAARRGIKRTLNKYGISRRNLFPGLDGIAEDLKWLETSSY